MLNYLKLYNHHIPQRAIGARTPVQALKEWQQKKPELFVKRVYDQARLDSPPIPLAGSGAAAVSFGLPNRYHHPNWNNIEKHTLVGWNVQPTFVTATTRGGERKVDLMNAGSALVTNAQSSKAVKLNAWPSTRRLQCAYTTFKKRQSPTMRAGLSA